MLTFVLTVLLQAPNIPFDTPVRITGDQVMVLKLWAQSLNEYVRDTSLKLADLESKQEFGPLREALTDGVAGASEAVNKISVGFSTLSTGKQQDQAATIFFTDLLKRYEQILDETIKLQPARYKPVRDRLLSTIRVNARAYEVVAETKSLTFNLEVKSDPPEAAVSYKRKREDYKPHTDATNTTIQNLAYARWIVRVQKKDFLDDEQEHDPFRETNHVISFKLRPK